MPIDKMDIQLTKSLVKGIDIAIQRVERRTESCDARGIITDFGAANQFIKETGPMIADMRMTEPDNKEILEMAQNFASIYNRYHDARFDFENKCVCKKKV